MFVTKYLLFLLFIYCKNVVETKDTSASADTSPGLGANSANKTNGSDRGLAAGEKDKGGYSATPELKLFKTGVDSNAVEMNKSDFYEDNYLNNHTYAFKQNVKCTLVKFGEAEVWKKGEHEVQEPKSVTYDTILREVTVRDADKSIYFKKHPSTGEWKHFVTIPRTKTAKADSTDSSGIAETSLETGDTFGVASAESGNTDRSPGGPDVTHTGGQSVDGSCASGTTGSQNAGDESITTAETSVPDGSAGKLSEGDGSSYTPPDNLNGESPTSKTKTQSGSASTASPKQSADGQSSQAGQQLGKVEDGRGGGSLVTTPSASSTRGAEDKAKKGTETAKRTGIEVCIKGDKKATPQFDYKKDGNTVTYTAKGDNGFKIVKQKNTEIWKAKDESEYATKVVLDGKGKKDKKVTIYLLNGTTKSYKKDCKGKEWKVSVQAGTESVTKKPNELDSNSNLVDLDIKNEKSTEFYDFKIIIGQYGSTNESLYFPKDKYIFKSVKEGSHVIWKTDKPENCSNKVSVYHSLYPNATNVWITFSSGNKKHFFKKQKSFKDGNWTEITPQANKK